MMNILQHLMQLPIIYLYFFTYARGILNITPVWSCHCKDISMFVSDCELPDVSETSVGFICVHVICTSPNDYKIITM